MAGVFVYLLAKGNLLIVCGTFITLGFLVSGKAEGIFGKKDAQCIVIDEASGMLVALLFLPYDIKLVIIAFCLFRTLDILKPYPIKKLQELKGGFGIMADDIAAGLCVNLILQVFLRLASFKVS